ncbi:hypothetical protein ABZP36_008669 [Zizania latifolia]
MTMALQLAACPKKKALVVAAAAAVPLLMSFFIAAAASAADGSQPQGVELYAIGCFVAGGCTREWCSMRCKSVGLNPDGVLCRTFDEIRYCCCGPYYPPPSTPLDSLNH